MNHVLSVLHFIILLLDFFSILVLVWGVLLAMFRFIKSEISSVSKLTKAGENNSIKNFLGSYVLLSLEILIAADIIESIINPSLTDIARLGAVVLIRIILSYFLSKEISEQQKLNK